MLSSSLQNLLLALIVVVPGFIASQAAISIGVVRTELSKYRILITSLALSLVVVSLFLAIVEWRGISSVSTPDDVGSIFFTPSFQPGLVLSLLGFSVLIGVVGGVGLALELPRRVRDRIWRCVPGDRQRNFHEPWEGTLNDAARVQVLTSDGAVAVGSLYMWSDDNEEKQIALTSVEWHSPSTEGWVDPETDIELFTGGDIEQVTVVDKKENSEE
jgi:hypothetical protein